MAASLYVQRRSPLFHVDQVYQDQENVPEIKDASVLIEGITTNIYHYRLSTASKILSLIPFAFIILAWSSYYVDFYQIHCFHWLGCQIPFNPITYNFVKCNRSHYETEELPSLLRMRAFHSPPNFFLRAAILPILFVRLLSTMVYVTKLSSHVKETDNDETFRNVPIFIVIMSLIESLSLSLFAVVHHQKDGYIQHVLVVVISFVVALAYMAAYLFDEIFRSELVQTPKIWRCAKFVCVGMFLATAPITLDSYLKFIAKPICTPLTSVSVFLCELITILSYLLFYSSSSWNQDVEIFIFSSQEDINPEVDKSCDEKVRPKIQSEKISTD